MSLTMIIILVVVFLVIVLAVLLVRASQNLPEDDTDLISQRLAEFSARGEQISSLDEIELSQPFKERVIYPALRNFGEWVMRFTPQRAMQNVEVLLERAGMGNVDASMFFALRFVMSFVLGGFLALMFWLSPNPQPLGRSILLVLGGGIMGFFLPQMYVTSKMQRRQEEIRKAMPDALDLLTICVEAGLGFDAAMAKVAEKWDNELALAFGRVIREIQLGKTRRDALKDMDDRIGLPEITSFVAAIIQSEQLGVSMANVLRIQAEQMRMKRRQRAEEKAHQAPVKMILPMAFLIFPSLFVILLAPAGFMFMNMFIN